MPLLAVLLMFGALVEQGLQDGEAYWITNLAHQKVHLAFLLIATCGVALRIVWWGRAGRCCLCHFITVFLD